MSSDAQKDGAAAAQGEPGPTDHEAASADAPQSAAPGADGEGKEAKGASGSLGEELSAADGGKKDTQYAAPKANRASAVFTAGVGDLTAQPPEEDPKEVVEALQAQIRDLSMQVTGLNNKLVASFERVADLEDEYSEAQRRLEGQTSKIGTLEKEREEHLAALNTGLLVEKSHVSSEMQRMMDRVIEETNQRGKAESDKKRIEEELEQLSANLFDEANRMVAVEKLARARAEEKAEAMQKSLKDTESVMLEQQKVLASLQRQIEDQQQLGVVADNASIKSGTEGMLKIESLARSPSQRTQHPGRAGAKRAMEPSMQVLLNVLPYREFVSFLHHIRKLRLQLRPFYSYPVPGGSRSATPALGSSDGGAASTTPGGSVTTPSQPASSPFALAGVARHRDYPNLPTTAEDMVKLSSQLSLPFIKRSQEEDTDPCLRLDIAPGLNWLSRRSTNTAILDGNLVIEPIFPGGVVPDADEVRARYAHMPPAACALCGTLVVNVPMGNPEPAGAAAAGAGAGDAHHDKSGGRLSSFTGSTSSWATSLSAVTGSAATSVLEAAGVRDRDRKAGAGKGDEASGSAAATPAATQDAAAAPKSRTGLFSGLRLASSSPKPEKTGSSITQRLPGLPGLGLGSSEQEDSNILSGHKAAFIPPIPTHIFRLSDSASARYLLCPHHCLDRLRAVCAFWGWIRTLERSIILEGRTPWDDFPSMSLQPSPRILASAPSSAPPADKELPLSPVTPGESPAVSALEAAAAHDEAKAGAAEDGKAEGDSQAEDAKATEDGKEATAEGKEGDAENGEKPADSSTSPEGDVGEGKKSSESTDEFVDASQNRPTTPGAQPPPVPARRRPVPPPPAGASAAAQAAPGVTLPRVTPTPPPAALVIARSVIPVEGGTDLSWEERMWQEVIKHKDDMYRARLGFREAAPA